jgi:hypothetical protein
VAAVGFELTRLAPAADERSATVGTGRTVDGGFGRPVGSLTLEREIFEQACVRAIPAIVERFLNFAQGGVRMLLCYAASRSIPWNQRRDCFVIASPAGM